MTKTFTYHVTETDAEEFDSSLSSFIDEVYKENNAKIIDIKYSTNTVEKTDFVPMFGDRTYQVTNYSALIIATITN